MGIVCLARKIGLCIVIRHREHVVIMAKSISQSKTLKSGSMLTYVSLFSSAGVGCYGFKEKLFNCVATVELLERRLKIQSYNQKCLYRSGYISGDLTKEEVQQRVFEELALWEKNLGVKGLDVLIATPPCQGMSVANHKKKDELSRNSLVVESIKLAKKIKPKFFVFENVRAFLTSICTDLDGLDKPIREAIENSLAGDYNIHCEVINFKDYGNPSSRTRTLVIGVRKDLRDVTPLDLMPTRSPERTLREIIGHLPPLETMGEICPDDIYHSFKRYAPHMESWISEIGEGYSAYDNTDVDKIPHRVEDGVVIYNAKKNGDKYTRQCWDKIAPCIHTRNDILASQNTVHPVDNRVFSIRELMLMMSIPTSFRWSDVEFAQLNALNESEKQAFLKKEEMNIRQNIGEAVPTTIFRQIAHGIKEILTRREFSEQEITSIVEKSALHEHENLLAYIRKNQTLGFNALSRIAEMANAKRDDNAAYYTRQDICYAVIKNLPDAKNYRREVNILEPSIGVGNFLPLLISKYKGVGIVNIDVVDIDEKSLEILRSLLSGVSIPSNVNINFIQADFLLHKFERRYDIIVGNPPYKKITHNKVMLDLYKRDAHNQKTNNIFAFFIERALSLGEVVSLIVPKSLIGAPEFNDTRALMKRFAIFRITDFGEKGFKGVKIETVSFIVSTVKAPKNTVVESYVNSDVKVYNQEYITERKFPCWLIYRNDEFDAIAAKMDFNIFRSYRDRTITKAITKEKGCVRVLKSRNIGDNAIVDIEDYDCFVDDVCNLDVGKFLNQKDCVLLPNLTYSPRACLLPPNSIADGSVAILKPLNGVTVTKADLSFYATDEFISFYAIARNRGTRSLNIDNNSVYFFGKLKE